MPEMIRVKGNAKGEVSVTSEAEVVVVGVLFEGSTKRDSFNHPDLTQGHAEFDLTANKLYSLSVPVTFAKAGTAQVECKVGDVTKTITLGGHPEPSTLQLRVAKFHILTN